MKKIMIAAAAAAMIGSVKADYLDPVVYQASYNLKTTIGKAATESIPVKLGKDNLTGKFWYEDPSVDGTYWNVAYAPLKITLIDTVNFKLVKKSGNWIPALTPAGLKNGAVLAVLAALEPTFKDQSAKQYCLTFNYAADHCYRIAGTIKVDGYFTDSECLEGIGAGNFPRILDCFGGATAAKCTKVELYSETFVTINPGAFYDPNTLVDKNGNPVAVHDNAKYPSDRTINELSIAGHGTYGKVFDLDSITLRRSTRPGLTQVSGYAVGAASMPTCETCCAPGTPVDVIIDCCGVGNFAETAVFGTFTFKYNDGETKKLY